ncbi:MAG: patatin-like phospholipase family protein [Bacteroidota bacterium]|nr:patatin-like phospholipase family protein [Bacteroidota bacterium]
MKGAIHWCTDLFLNIAIKPLLVLFLSAFLCFQVLCQQTSPRPKIGLALSGGGSLGIAHLGVIKVMEEAGLRPDYITGVSMGSIIGGMYSVGYSSDSILHLLKKMDWDLLLSTNIPETKVIFPEKEHFNNSIIEYPVFSKKFQLPSGLISGQQIENQLSYYLWPVAGINDFSKFPIPFLCIGTDLVTGNMVHLASGYLPQAIRASMAVPTIFTPVKIDTALLTDGGVIRNYPAEEVRKMGADIIIGSYTGFLPYKDTRDLESITGIVKQIALLASLKDFESQKKITNILIIPKVKDLNSSVFTNVDTIYSRGYKAALPFREKMKRLADSLNSFGSQKPLDYILDRRTWTFNKVQVTGNRLYSNSQIRGILDIKPGDKVDKDALYNKIDLLYGKRWFENVSYRILSENDSLILSIDCKERPKIMLYGGVYYDNYIRAGIVLRTTFKDLISRNSFLDLDFFLGQFYRLKLSLLQFIDMNQKFGISADFYYDYTELPIINLVHETGPVFYRNRYAGFSLNRYLGLNQMMNISVTSEMSAFEPDFVSENGLRSARFNSFSTGYTYLVNTLNTKNFPDKGTQLRISATASKLLSGVIRTDLGKETYRNSNPGDYSFDRIYTFSGYLRHYFSVGNKLTFTLKGNLLYTLGQDTAGSPHNLYYLGGIEPVTRRSIPAIGFLANEIPVRRIAGGGIDMDIEIINKVHLNLLTNVFAAKEIPETKTVSLLGGYGVGLGYMSIIGPLKVGIMHGLSNTDRHYSGVKGFISIGYSF